MTTQKDLKLTDSIAANSNGVILDPQTAGEEKSSFVETQPAFSLRKRLLTTVLPITLIPLVIVGGIGYLQTEAQLKARQLLQLEAVGLLSASATSLFLDTHLEFHGLIENNTLVQNALKAGSKQVTDQGLSQQSVDTIEQRFASTKLLQPNTALNSYLQQAATNAGLTEIVVTERNGFNVGFNKITTDFIQNDKVWWQQAQEFKTHIGSPEFDTSANQVLIGLTQQIRDEMGEMVGVMKLGLPLIELTEALRIVVLPNLSETEIVQLVDVENADNPVVETITVPENNTEIKEILGGTAILAAAKILKTHDHGAGEHLEHQHGEEHAGDIEQEETVEQANVQTQLENISGFQNLKLTEKAAGKSFLLLAQFTYQDRYYNLSLIPNTKMVITASVDISERAALARDELTRAGIPILILAGLLVAALYWLAQTLSTPLKNLTNITDEARAGNLNVRANVEGTRETQVLARAFNTLVSDVQNLLTQSQQTAKEQTEARDKLEMEIYQLIEEVDDATDGDLTVRASLTSIEMSTVADLFNAIIDSLNEMAVRVKVAAVRVCTCLDENGKESQTLANQAVQETEQALTTLDSVEQMSISIGDVATNAGRASVLSDEAYTTVQAGSSVMDQTVDSILSLRNTVGATSKKIKRLGESSQKISQVVSLLEEIALKTNLLAINASVEASRAGEQGQGFTVVAEQVGALAEQSTAATREITQIVASIQTETKEVTEAMEVSTIQVVDSAHLIETTQDKLTQALKRSQEINDLMQSISSATVCQTETSKTMTTLMHQMAKLSEQRSESSSKMAQSMQDTVDIAKNLEAAVVQFKLEEIT